MVQCRCARFISENFWNISVIFAAMMYVMCFESAEIEWMGVVLCDEGFGKLPLCAYRGNAKSMSYLYANHCFYE